MIGFKLTSSKYPRKSMSTAKFTGGGRGGGGGEVNLHNLHIIWDSYTKFQPNLFRNTKVT